jgi:hypothetical protein
MNCTFDVDKSPVMKKILLFNFLLLIVVTTMAQETNVSPDQNPITKQASINTKASRTSLLQP